MVAVNQPPTINAIAPVTILENSGTQTLNLAGIGPGPGDKGQTVTITASSSNPTLIPIPAITYNNPSTTGSLTYAPTPFDSGTALITLTLMDNGGTANGGQNTTIETSPWWSCRSTSRPRSTRSPTPLRSSRMRGQQVVNLTGISDGIGDLGQTVTVTAISSNPGLINPTVTITHPTGSTDAIVYTPTANTTGTARISVIVSDNGGTSNGGIDTFVEHLHRDGHGHQRRRPRSRPFPRCPRSSRTAGRRPSTCSGSAPASATSGEIGRRSPPPATTRP